MHINNKAVALLKMRKAVFLYYLHVIQCLLRHEHDSRIKRKDPRTKPEEFLKDTKQTAKLSHPRYATGIALREGIEGKSANLVTSFDALSLQAPVESAATSFNQTGLDNTGLNIREYLNHIVLSIINNNTVINHNNTVIPVQTGIQKDSTTNQPLLLASNGPSTGLVESLPRYEDTQNLPQPLFYPDGHTSKEGSSRNFNSFKAPPFLKGDKGGFSNSTTQPITLALAHDAPTAADLAQTIDVQLTPAIKAKAQELNYSPVKIYNWVRNNVEYVPTYGSIQGADMCLQTMQGNDFDIASLLIALLRASGIHARYVYGTIELPIEKVMNWIGGFTDGNAALNFIGSGGTPVAGLISGGKISAARMEHVWVEAYVKYLPSRGARNITGQRDSWLPLDASYKQYEYIAPADLKNVISTDMQALAEQLKNSATVSNDGASATGMNAALLQQAMDSAKQELKAHVQNSPDMKISALTGGKRIISKNLPLIPVTLPYIVIVNGLKMSDLTDNFRHTIKIEILDSNSYEQTLSFQAHTASLGNKRITLSYHPANASDVQTLNSYGGILQTPCYLVNMRPVLKIDGVNKIAGNLNVNPGTEQPLQITMSSPRIGTEVINTKITAGDYKALVFNLGHVSPVEFEKQRDAFAQLKEKINSEETINADDLIGASLHVTGLNYWMQLEMNNAISANHSGVVRTQLLSEGIFSHDVVVNYLYGVPRSISDGGLNVDVKRNLAVTIAKDGDAEKARNYVYAAGCFSSAMEHGTLEMIYQTQAISAVKAIAEANQRGIPIFKITSTNVNIILPQLTIDQDTKTDITNALNAGKEVIVPKTEFSLNNWSGAGYIIYDPVTGAGAYMIGGLAGAGEIIDSLLKDIQNAFSYVGGIMDDYTQAFAEIEGTGTNLAKWFGYILIIGVEIIDFYKAMNAGLEAQDLGLYMISSITLNLLIDTIICYLFQLAVAIFIFNPILGVAAILAAAALAYIFTDLVNQFLNDLLKALASVFDDIKSRLARFITKARYFENG